MIAWLTAKLAPLALPALGVVALLMMGLVAYTAFLRADVANLEKDNASLTRDRDIALEGQEAAKAAFDRQRQDHARALDAITADLAAARSRAARLAPIRKGIADAPISDDGPVSRVLRSALDGLRDRTGGDAD